MTMVLVPVLMFGHQQSPVDPEKDTENDKEIYLQPQSTIFYSSKLGGFISH